MANAPFKIKEYANGNVVIEELMFNGEIGHYYSVVYVGDNVADAKAWIKERRAARTIVREEEVW